MNVDALLQSSSLLWSPLSAAALMGLAILFIWSAFAPARPAAAVRERLDDYLHRRDAVDDQAMRQPFLVRLFEPPLRWILRVLGSLAPKRSVQSTEMMLLQAGQPGRLSALDFFGLRLLFVLLAGGICFLLLRGQALSLGVMLRDCIIAGVIGYFIPWLWLRGRVRSRQHEIERALPDALDMLTISVAAGLAFESAMLRVSDRWQNALTREFQRAVAEMRIGVPRDEALTRMAERTGVPDLRAFVAVLIQSGRMGVSIADVLTSQAAEMRIRRRQRAEELARQASVKMVFPLVFLIFPALFVVVLGPSVPAIMGLFRQLGAR
jgi:tight adherence protein C